MPDSWLRFWDRPNRIYVNDRHLAAHYAQVADDIISILPPRPGLRLLDFGCGEALEARRVASRLGRLYLYDAAPSVRERVARRFAGAPGIEVLDDRGFEALPPGSLDAIFVSSVVHYVDRSAFPGLLASWRRLLSQGGLVVIADSIPPGGGLAGDVASLLWTGWRHGFFWAALGSLATGLVSGYGRLRRRLGFAVYTDEEMLAILRDAGLEGERYGRNLGFHPGRRTYLARRKGPA